MRRPTADQFTIAISWLECNEGQEGGEAEACKAVAQWLADQELERSLRNAARKGGVTYAALRRRLAENAATQSAGQGGEDD